MVLVMATVVVPVMVTVTVVVTVPVPVVVTVPVMVLVEVKVVVTVSVTDRAMETRRRRKKGFTGGSYLEGPNLGRGRYLVRTG